MYLSLSTYIYLLINKGKVRSWNLIISLANLGSLIFIMFQVDSINIDCVPLCARHCGEESSMNQK